MDLGFRYILLIAMLTLSGCGAIQQAMAPEKQTSDMRAAVVVPVIQGATESTFCLKPVVNEPTLKMVVAQAEPAKTIHANLYFLLDQVKLTPQSETESEKIYQDIIDLNPSKIFLVGHTDTSASDSYNDQLSRRRAEAVKQALIDAGISAEIIETSAQGEYDLEVFTPDNTVDERNRRVSIDAR